MNRHAELTTLLRGLKLQAMADHVSDVAVKAGRANLSHEAFLYELVRLEQEQRTQRRIDRLRRESGVPREKTFATLDLTSYPPLVRPQVERLRRGEFVAQAVNVGAVGPPGVGKSRLLASGAHTLMQQGVAVLWSSTAQLMQRLLAAKRDLRLPQELAKLDRFACLVLDDIGYVQHDQDEMEVLCTLLSERYERRSVMLSTNLVFSEWTRIFKHPLTTVAAIDRVVHHSVILDLTGMPSYRAPAARAAQQAGAPASDTAVERPDGADVPMDAPATEGGCAQCCGWAGVAPAGVGMARAKRPRRTARPFRRVVA